MSSYLILLISLILFSYLLGSIPTSYLVSRLKGIDLLTVGSGNLGATNVYRALGFKLALFVFFCDLLKGFIPAYLAVSFEFSPLLHILVGVFSVLGHSCSIFMRFKGGKGVATALGVILSINYNVFVILFLMGILLIKLTSTVSLVSILGAILFPILLIIFQLSLVYIVFACFLSIYIIYLHRLNILRLLKGTENKI